MLKVSVAHVAKVSAIALGGAAHAAGARSSALLTPPPPRSENSGSTPFDTPSTKANAQPITSMAQLIEHTLSLHEKAALCTMISRKAALSTAPSAGRATSASIKSAGCAVSALFNEYLALCKRDKMLTPLPRAEFATMVGGMVDKGVLSRPGRSRPGHLHRNSSSSSSAVAVGVERTTNVFDQRVTLGVAEMDVLRGIGDIGILRRFFD